MKILHVLDHSIPVQDGYSFRTRAILLEQQRRGLETVQITSSEHEGNNSAIETIDGLTFHRTQAS